MTFRVGQKVVCVDARSGSSCLYDKKVYTCLAIEPEYLRVDCCAGHDPEKHRWFTHRFRPIVERKTDISALQALLVPGAKIREMV